MSIVSKGDTTMRTETEIRNQLSLYEEYMKEQKECIMNHDGDLRTNMTALCIWEGKVYLLKWVLGEK